MKKVLSIFALLALAFSSVQACSPCGDIKILPTKTLKSCANSQSETVEVIIYNPGYCYSNITDISVSDDANFDLNRSFGDVPCGDASTVSMRGYQYCTVGLTFKPITTSGTFTTDIQVTDRDTGVHTATVNAKVSRCCHRHKICHRHKACHRHISQPVPVNYLANLNLVSPVPSTHVYVDNKTLIFNEYFEANEGLATVALDDTVDSISRLTFDVNKTDGLFMPRMAGDNGSYYTNDIRKTSRYGFMFPAGNPLHEINFTTWGVGFTGVVSNLSLIKVDDFNASTPHVSKNCFPNICTHIRAKAKNFHRDFHLNIKKICKRNFHSDRNKSCRKHLNPLKTHF